MKFFFWAFVVNFFILMWIGSQHPNTPYVEIGQIATAFYFAWFILIVPMVGLFENTLMDLATEVKELTYSSVARAGRIGSLIRLATTGAVSTTVSVTDNELDSLLAGVFREVYPSNEISVALLESFGLHSPTIVSYVEKLGYIIT
jgi:hypothetical protein